MNNEPIPSDMSMGEAQAEAVSSSAARRLPGVLVLVGAATVFVGATRLPWIVGFVTRGLSGESSFYASLAFVGLAIVGIILGGILAIIPNRNVATFATVFAMFAGLLLVITYWAYSARVGRLVSSHWAVQLGPAPSVAAVGAITWFVGGCVGSLDATRRIAERSRSSGKRSSARQGSAAARPD